METVVVLMSTYNGEKYLQEQLYSIFRQTGVDIKLIIRDDGSTDNTVSIIYDFQAKFPNKIELIIGNNIGWRKSFFSLIKYAYLTTKCDYYAFCDQDDIWLSEKLKESIFRIKEMPTIAGPRFYCSNLYYYKDEINFGKIIKVKPHPTYKNCLVRNYATGCTIVYDYAMLQLLCKETPNILIAHDYWAYMVAVLCGQIYYDEESFILYRQHDNNQIGYRVGIIEVWKRRFNNLFNSAENKHFREKTAVELRRIFGDKMNKEALSAVNKVSDYRSSLSKRIKLLFDNGFTLNNISNDFWLKMRILFGQL